MFAGARVVRGPDWKWGDQDGGHGSVGTVLQGHAKEGSGVWPVWVRWDSGKAASYRAGGKSGKFDLRIYDTAQLGVKHPSVTCDTCGKDPIVGIRWKCQDCHNFDLCHPCYNEGKHDLGHQFFRIEGNSMPGIKVPCRLDAIKCRSLGIFPGARVVRGPDWIWENQDGGDGAVGAVRDVSDGQGTYRSWVMVRWPNGNGGNYRRGHQGQMDVIYTQKETGGEFYIEHLPKLDASKLRGYVSSGDKVRLLAIDIEKLKELQQERCGWREEIINFKDKVGEVMMIDKDGDVKVDFGVSSFFIHPLCLAMEKKKVTEKETTNDIQDLVVSEVLSAIFKSELQKLLNVDGSSDGAELFSAAINGRTSRVREIIKETPEAVKFQTVHGHTALAGAAYHGHMDSVIALVEGKAPLDITDEDGDTALANAVISNQPDIAKYLLQSGCSVNTSNNNGLSPLHLAAVRGHGACAEVLLGCERHCNVNAKDKNGNTSLFVAIIKDEKQIIRLLVDHNETNLKIRNDNGFNALHHAVFYSNTFAVQRILSKAPSMINIAKDDGFTALHLAAFNGLADIVLILIKQGNCDKELRINNGPTALHIAVDRTHNKCIEALVNNGANVNAQDNDGDTCLHLVMMKASLEEVLGSLPAMQVLQLAQQLLTEGKKDSKENLVAIAAYLVKNNANIHIKNKKGNDVLDVTRNPRVKTLLRELYDRKRDAAEAVSCKVQ